MTTVDPDTLERDPEVLRDIGRRFGGRLAPMPDHRAVAGARAKRDAQMDRDTHARTGPRYADALQQAMCRCSR